MPHIQLKELIMDPLVVTIRAEVTGEQLLPVTWKSDGTVTRKQLLPVTWKIDGNVVSQNENIDIQEQGDARSITINKRVLPGGRHQITIKAENALGADTKDITVEGKYNTIIKGRPYDSRGMGGYGLF